MGSIIKTQGMTAAGGAGMIISLFLVGCSADESAQKPENSPERADDGDATPFGSKLYGGRRKYKFS